MQFWHTTTYYYWFIRQMRSFSHAGHKFRVQQIRWTTLFTAVSIDKITLFRPIL